MSYETAQTGAQDTCLGNITDAGPTGCWLKGRHPSVSIYNLDCWPPERKTCVLSDSACVVTGLAAC